MDLRHRGHHNVHLQRSWNKHGESQFVFEFIEDCNQDDLLDREQDFLDKTPNSYNLTAVIQGGSRLGQKNSAKHNAAISRANKGKPSWNRGGKNTWIDKVVASRVSKYKDEVVAEHSDGTLRRFSHASQAARSLGLGRTSVKNILNGYSKITRSGWTFRYEPKS